MKIGGKKFEFLGFEDFDLLKKIRNFENPKFNELDYKVL